MDRQWLRTVANPVPVSSVSAFDSPVSMSASPPGRMRSRRDYRFCDLSLRSAKGTLQPLGWCYRVSSQMGRMVGVSAQAMWFGSRARDGVVVRSAELEWGEQGRLSVRKRIVQRSVSSRQERRIVAPE